MAGKIMQVRIACKMLPEDRTEEHVNDIFALVHDVKLFSQLTIAQIRSLCRTLSFEFFSPGTTIFNFGERGDKYYIILTGQVSIQAPIAGALCPLGTHLPENCECPNRAREEIIKLNKGASFGESALTSEGNSKRIATVVAIEETECLTLTRGNWEQFAGTLHRLYVEQRVAFLRRCPNIEDALLRCQVSTQDIYAMANCLKESSVSDGSIVAKQGDPVENIVFVRSGQLAVIRTVDVDQTRQLQCKSLKERGRQDQGKVGTSKQRMVSDQSARGFRDGDECSRPSLPSDCHETITDSGLASQRSTRTNTGVSCLPDLPSTGSNGRKVLLRVGTLGPFSYFGDQELARNECFPVSLVSDPMVDIFTISKQDLTRRCPKKILAAFFGGTNSFPSDVQLLEMYKQTVRWDSFRKSMHRTSARSGRRAGLHANSNSEFLGVRPPPTRYTHGSPKVPRGVTLTLKDEEYFSQATAGFLRRLGALQMDAELHNYLNEAGVGRQKHIRSVKVVTEDEDPNAFSFDVHWSKVGQNPITLDGIDVEESAVDELAAKVLPPFALKSLLAHQNLVSRQTADMTLSAKGEADREGSRDDSSNHESVNLDHLPSLGRTSPEEMREAMLAAALEHAAAWRKRVLMEDVGIGGEHFSAPMTPKLSSMKGKRSVVIKD